MKNDQGLKESPLIFLTGGGGSAHFSNQLFFKRQAPQDFLFYLSHEPRIFGLRDSLSRFDEGLVNLFW